MINSKRNLHAEKPCLRTLTESNTWKGLFNANTLGKGMYPTIVRLAVAN